MTAFFNAVAAKWRRLSDRFDPATRHALAMAVAWLIIVNLFALMAFNRLNLAPDTAFEWMSPGTVRPVQQSWDIIELHNRWDAYWYLSIAGEGYDLRGETDISNVVFFPLYPLLVRGQVGDQETQPAVPAQTQRLDFLRLAGGDCKGLAAAKIRQGGKDVIDREHTAGDRVK